VAKHKWTSETAPRAGNPLAGKRQALVEAFLRSAKPRDVDAVAKVLAKLAMGGDVQAAREWLDRLLGKPAQNVEVEAGESLADVLQRLAAVKAAQERTPGAP